MRVWFAVLAVLAMGVPAQAGYKIMSDDRFDARRVVAVELLERVRAQRLAKISDALKARDAKAYERTIINFYLPRMNLGSGSWATVSYTPERQTTINGLTREEELAFIAKIRKDTRNRIGSWITSSTAIAGEVTIFRKDGKKFVEWSLRNGIKSTDEITETRTWRGRRFDIRSGSKTHFLINNKNDLEIRDVKGLVATGEHILSTRRARQFSALQHSRSRLGARLPDDVVRYQEGSTVGTPSGLNQDESSSLSPPRPMPASNLSALSPSGGPPLATIDVAKKPRKVRRPRRPRRTANDILMQNFMR